MTEAKLLTVIEERAGKGDSNTAFSAEQAKALRYYFGEQFGNEAPDRSRIVTREVYSTIEWIKPALMKMFFGSERAVEFRPKGANDVAAAEQETDYINHVITDRNDGFLQFLQWFTDALLLKNGYMLAWWDERIDVTESVYEGLDMDTLTILAGEDDVQIIEQEEDSVDETTGEALYTVRLREKTSKGQVRIKCLKPENVCIDARHDSVSLKDTTFAMYEEEETISSLREQGFEIDDEDYSDEDQTPNTAREIERARLGLTQSHEAQDRDDADPASRKVMVQTIFLRVDFDGDGTAEMRRVIKCGKKILYNEVEDGVNIAAITPTIVAHRHMGMGVADVLTDIQEIKSMLTRGYVDNVALANNGRYFVDDERVNMDDMLISRPGGVVRVEGGVANAVQPFEHPMIGNTVVQAIEYFDNMIENRTGASPRVLQGQSFDGNAINKTATGINAIMSAAMARIELIARIFAETGVQDLYRIIHKLTLKHNRKADVFRLRGEYHEVDPRQWDTREDMSVAGGLGTGDTQGRITALQQLITAQQNMIDKGTGLANRQTLYNALAKLAQLMGYPDPTFFWVKPDSPQMPPQAPDPQIELDKRKLDIEAERRKSDAQIRNRQIDADMQKAKMQQTGDQQKTSAQLAQQAKIEKMKADEERIKLGIAPDDVPEPDEIEQLMAELQALQAEAARPKRVMHQYDEEGKIIASQLG